MARFLITGAKGQVGSCLVQQLAGKAEILAFDREGLDITLREAVFDVVKNFRPDVIINAAAYTAVDKAETDVARCEAVNIQAVQYLAEAAQAVGALFVHLSTDYVFDGNSEKPYQEMDEPNPQSIYGKTKLAGEQVALAINARTVILRTAWVFGECGNNFVKTMLRLGSTRDILGVVGDQCGGPTYAGDIASTLIHLANDILAGRSDAFGVYHFSGKPYVSWYEFAEAIFEEADLQRILKKRPLVSRITTSDYFTAAKRPTNSRLDLTKIQTVFGIAPSDWRKALKNMRAYIE